MPETHYPDCACCGGGGGIQTDCCAGAVPTTLTGTFTPEDCPCLASPVSFSLVYDEGSGRWTNNTAVVCDDTLLVEFTCAGGGFFLSISSGGCFYTDLVLAFDCDPFEVVFPGIDGCSFCTSFSLTVTE